MEHSYQWLVLLSMPVLGGIIGWVTNYLAIVMLFHPRQAWGSGIFRFQGLVPKRHHELAEKISQAAARDFFTHTDLKDLVTKTDIKPVIREYILKQWELRIGEILSVMPMISMFLPPEKLEAIRDKLVDAICEDSAGFTGELAAKVAESSDLAGVIKSKILDFDLDKLEAIVMEISSREFKFIERLGGILGFLIGVIQAIIAYFL